MKNWYLILLLIVAKWTFAQDVTFKASAPEIVEVGQQFRLTYSVNAKAQNFNAQAVNGIHVLAGPSTSQSSNVSIVNGKVTQNFELRYTYIVQVTEEGVYDVPPAEVTVEGKVYKSNSVKIEAIKADPNAEQRTRAVGMNQTQQQQNTNQISKDDLYLRVYLNKLKIHREEHVVATIKLFTRVPIAGFGSFKLPTFDGFLTEDIYAPSTIEWTRENINGQIYNTGVLRKYILFPQKEGSISISPAELEVAYQKPSKRRSRSVFEELMGGGYDNLQTNLVSNEVKLTVESLPANKPYDYSGAVGNLKLEASIDNNSVKTNDAINLKVKISGNGNIKYINPLKIDFPTDFDVYDPKVNDNIKYSEKGALGSKNFEYLMIPRHAGEFTIPEFRFTYFDTQSNQYKTEKAGPFNINVEKSAGDSTVTVTTAFTKEDVRFLGKDIRFIKSRNIKWKAKGQFLFGSIQFYLTYVILIVLFTFVFIYRKKKVKENANVMLVKNKKANKFARKRLNKASGFMKQGQKEAFYEELVKALWGYISDKLGIPLADLSKENARIHMLENNVNEEYINQILDIIDRCEYARYAPVTEETKMDTLYNDAIKVISKIQQKLK